MSRTPVTIVIPVWNQWELTRACLESLRPTLGVRDQVVIVDNGSEDGTAAGLRQYSWATVITNEVNRGFAVACNQGAAASTRDIVVFLNNDTLVPGHWLDGLLEPFVDDSVGATGPRSNMVSGPQLIDPSDVTYATGRMSELRRFAKEWRMAHRRQVTDVERLVGFCLAVRTSAFTAAGGFDEGFEIGGFEDDDLCRRLRTEGWRLLITHESFVHHHGHATFDGNGLDWLAVQNTNQDRYMEKHTGRRPGQPLLSAALIVKDEEKFLGACLESLTGLVDEIVVYDTGSTDGTVAIAEQAGATVIEGYWDDDFARARNAALEHYAGEWILSIDADEVVEGDRDRLRHNLAAAIDFDVCMVEIENLGGTEDDHHLAVAHRMSRLFRRDRAEWRHRLHEQIVPKGHRSELRGGTVDEIKLIHSGYLTETMIGRDKLERNIRIAQTDIDDGADRGGDTPLLLLNLARSLVLGGRIDEAMERFREIRASDCIDSVRRAALRHGAETLLNQGQPEEALTWAEELAVCSEDKGLARYLEGTARLMLGQHAEAAALLDDVEALTVEEGIAFSTFAAKAPTERVKTLRLADDCAADLDKLATRALADLGTDSIAVAAVVASSSAGSIAPTLDKVAVATLSGPVPPGLRAFAMRPPLPAIPLRGLDLDREHPRALMMNLALEWRRDGIALAAALDGRAPAPRGGPDRAPDGGIAIEMPLLLANATLDRLSGQRPIRVKLDPEEISLSDLHVVRGGPGLVVTARATSVTVGERFDVAVDLGGADLHIADSRVSPVLEDCNTVGMIERLACSTRNAGRGAAAHALAAALRQQIQGKLVRTLLGTRSFSFEFGGRAVTVTGAFSRLGAREDALNGDAVVAVP